MLPSQVLQQYYELVQDDALAISLGDPAFIKMPVAKVVKNNTISLKTSLKPTNTGDIVSIDSNLFVY